MKKTLLSLVIAATIMAFGASAYAATRTATMNVSLTGLPTVSVSVGDMYFGSFAVGEFPSTLPTTTITVIMPNGTPYAISLDAGQHSNPVSRLMVSGSYGVNYGLYKSDLTEWGDNDYANTYPNGSSLHATGTGAAQPYTVHGQAESSVGAEGNYSDVVTVTVNY